MGSGAGDKAPLLKAFIEYILSAEGQALLAKYNFEGVSQAVIDVSTAAIDMMTMPAGVRTWTFETSTNKGGGQADYVISAKRRSHYEYAIGEVESEMATAADLAAAVASLSARLDTCSCSDDDDSGGPNAASGSLGIIGLVLGLIGCGLGGMALLQVSKLA